MLNDAKDAIYNGGPFQSYWWADEHEPVHPAIRLTLKHPVDEDALKKAWDKMKKLYPLFDAVPDDFDEEILFFRGEGESVPVRSENVLKIASEAVLYRGFSLTFFEETITLSAYHSLVDEIGLMKIASDLMRLYFSIKDDTEVSLSVNTENRGPEEYFIQSTMLSPDGYEPQPVMLYHDIRHIFSDPEAANDENGIMTGKLILSADEFDGLCKRLSAEPDEMIACVMARAVYKLFPEERRALSLGFMTDFREVFGVCNTIAPCSKKLPLVLEYDEVMNGDGKEAAGKISSVRKVQKSDDYIKSHVAMENTYAVLNIRNACVSVNYAGTFDIGESTSEIADISMSDYSGSSLFMVYLGDEVQISLQYGKVTEKYQKAVKDVLVESGLSKVEVSGPYRIEKEIG